MRGVACICVQMIARACMPGATMADAGHVLHVAGIVALVLALGLLLRRALPVSVERGWYECGPVALVIWDYGACLCWKRVIRFSWGCGNDG